MSEGEKSPQEETIGKTRDETLYPDLVIDPPMVVTSKDKKRYEANDVFSKAIFEDFLMFINKEGGMGYYEEIYDKAMQISESLSVPQKKVFERVLREIKHMQQEANRVSPGTYKDEFRKISRVLDIPEEKISDDDIEVTPLGSTVVYIDDDGVRKKVLGDGVFGYARDRDDRFVMSMVLDRAGLGNTGETERVLDRAMGTIFVWRDANDPKRSAETRKHELFHHLYERALAPHTEVLYPTNSEKKFFQVFKNELMAYLLIGKWKNDEESFWDGSTCGAVDEKGAGIWGYMLDNIKSNATSNANEADGLEVEARRFYFEYEAVLRELTRLKYLRSPLFDEATKLVMTCQDFKEIAFKLSKLETDKNLDAFEIVPGSGNLNALSVPEMNSLSNYLYRLIRFRLPCGNLDEMMGGIAVFVQKSEQALDNSPERRSAIDYLSFILSEYRKCKETGYIK